MPYQHFDATKPDATTQSGAEFGQSVLDNQRAHLDMLLMGVVPGWSSTYTGADMSKPTVFTYANGAQRRRITVVFGTNGGETGNVVSATYEASYDGGTSYNRIGAKTISYDAESNVTGTAWSN